MTKSLVALVMAVLSIINLVWGIDLFGSSYTEEIVGIIIAALMPILVWFVPNAEHEPARRTSNARYC